MCKEITWAQSPSTLVQVHFVYCGFIFSKEGMFLFSVVVTYRLNAEPFYISAVMKILDSFDGDTFSFSFSNFSYLLLKCITLHALISRCHPNYGGSQCQHKDSTCHPNPCLNQGTCQSFMTDRGMEWQCLCPKEYTGEACQHENVCECQYGSCDDSGVCRCDAGYAGGFTSIVKHLLNPIFS